jgi:glucan phosphoethanolaminetransferase (alkaline phosphatase superfamily)
MDIFELAVFIMLGALVLAGLAFFALLISPWWAAFILIASIAAHSLNEAIYKRFPSIRP